MSTQTDPKLSKWPFFLGDAVLIGLAYFLYSQSKLSMGHWDIVFTLVCCMVGAGFCVAPFLIEYRAGVRLSEANALVSAAEQMKNLESIAVHISAATAQWQVVQEQSGKTVGAAKDIAERLTAEAAAFAEFLKKSNDGEKANLRLEVEKLRRAESDWLQVIVRTLDHVYALHQAGLRSGQSGLIEQLGQFHNACRDVARRIGLVPFAPAPGEPFNPQLHQLADGQSQPPADAKVRDALATGYTMQGQLLRPALVALQADVVVADPAPVAEVAVVMADPAPAPVTEVAALELDGKPAPGLLEEQALL
jgi:molecular chaperone GrpE (heat shock protein)